MTTLNLYNVAVENKCLCYIVALFQVATYFKPKVRTSMSDSNEILKSLSISEFLNF